METFAELLKTFAIDYWYKMLILASLIFMFVALTMPIHAIPNSALFLLSFGGFLIGMGEWINHPYQEAISLDHSYKVTGHPRKPKVGGIACDVIGAFLLTAGSIKVVMAAFA